MSRVLNAPTLDAVAQRLAPPAPVLDAATRELLATAEQEAFSRGRAEGEAAGRDELAATVERVTGALGQALQRARAELLELEARRAEELVDVAAELASAVLGCEPTGDGRTLLARAREALAQLDHGPFTVEVASADASFVDEASLDLSDGSRIEASPALRPGEARIRGPWSQADLTREALLALAAEAMASARRSDEGGGGPTAIHRAGGREHA